jgi:hypothetical protein
MEVEDSGGCPQFYSYGSGSEDERGAVGLVSAAPYLSPARFFPSIITLLNIRLIRVW